MDADVAAIVVAVINTSLQQNSHANERQKADHPQSSDDGEHHLELPIVLDGSEPDVVEMFLARRQRQELPDVLALDGELEARSLNGFAARKIDGGVADEKQFCLHGVGSVTFGQDVAGAVLEVGRQTQQGLFVPFYFYRGFDSEGNK